MKQFKLWVRINQTQTAYTLIYADNAYSAKQLGEAQYGIGNVLNYTEVQGSTLVGWGYYFYVQGSTIVGWGYW